MEWIDKTDVLKGDSLVVKGDMSLRAAGLDTVKCELKFENIVFAGKVNFLGVVFERPVRLAAARVGHGDWYPTTKHLKIGRWDVPLLRFRTLAMTEAVLGWLLMTLFVVSLGKTWL